MKLIVGLGNPVLRQAQDKDKYSGTRHNVGFMVVDELGKKMDGGGWKVGVEDGSWKMDKKFKSEILRGVYTERSRSAQDDILLAKPQTYMNNSGLAVKLLMSNLKCQISNVIVVHDDLDILLGKVKVRQGGAAGGHHGVESIIASLGSDQFWRVKVGIGNDKSHSGEHERVHFDAERFVLEEFTPEERPAVKHAIKQSIEEIGRLVQT